MMQMFVKGKNLVCLLLFSEEGTKPADEMQFKLL